MKFDMLKEFGSFLEKQVQDKFNWVTALPVYQHLYNTTHHKSLGKLKCDYNNLVADSYHYTGCSPFEVFYGRISNFETCNQQIKGDNGTTSGDENVGIEYL